MSDLGIWGTQVDEMMAEVAAHHHEGNMLALERLAASTRRWLWQSPCPNAAVLALEYTWAALDNPPPNARWTEQATPAPQLVKVALPEWGFWERQERQATVPSFIPAGRTVRNWLGDPAEGCE